MSEEGQNTIIVFGIEHGPQAELDDRPFEARGRVGDFAYKVISHLVPVEQAQQNVTQFLSSVQAMLAQGMNLSGEFKLDTVEINAQISADGKVGFMGNEVGAAGSAGIKFILKRPSD